MAGCLLIAWAGVIVASKFAGMCSSVNGKGCDAVAVVGKVQPWRKGQSKKLSKSKKAIAFVVQGKSDDFAGLVTGVNGVASSR